MRRICFICLIFLFGCSKSDKLKDIFISDFSGNSVSAFNSSKKLNAYFFLAPECPLSQNYTKPIQQYYQNFSVDAAFYLAFSGKVYTDEQVQEYLSDYELDITSLKDTSYVLRDVFKASITPEVFLVDENENVVYSGKIDNWIESLGVKRQVVTEFYLKDAISNFLDGKPIEISKTEAVGCILE